MDDSEDAIKEAVTTALEDSKTPLRDFWEILYLHKNTRDGAAAQQFYVRTEKLLNRDCGVYELYDNGQLGHGNCRVWVDLETGCWLKYQNLDENTTFEVLVFKLSGLAWNSALRP
jgi:outer membrane lipoprotein-sorting protein